MAIELKQCLSLYYVTDLFVGEIAKKKWKNTKDTFRRELQKEPKPRSDAESVDYQSKWPFFRMMFFCKDVLTPSYTTGNLPDTDLDVSNDSCSSENTEIEVEANWDNTAEYSSSTATTENTNLSNKQTDTQNVKQKKNKIRRSDETNRY